ncbi:MAG: F0F1 ATP synthase subunit A [Candidatus Gracilibacteria bacterium]|nr:F0F1 ATP synthase subunit A [Candidatus Gracilibacteria bacterium]
MDILHNFLGAYYHSSGENVGINPYFLGILVVLGLIFIIYFFITKKPNSSFSIFFDMVYEGVYGFFEDILGVDEKKWTKLYITSMFFVILLSNLLGVFLEILGVGLPFLHHTISIPTSDINFNVAMAIVGVCIVIYEQFKFLGFGKALYEYVPFMGKDYIPYERGKLNKYIDIPLFIFVKFFDIVISLFLGILEIVGHGAKIISLSFRLFGNITSGGMLLAMLLAGVELLTGAISGFIFSKEINFPIIFPLILHLQGLLVALIQALVFPLLIAIFIKVAKAH